MLGSWLIDADECVRQGAFDEALAPARVLDRALEMARELAVLDRTMYARTKLELRAAAVRAMRVAAESDPLLGHRVESEAGGGAWRRGGESGVERWRRLARALLFA